MFERYTEKARRAIFFARYEASQFGSPYIETEHLLLGLLREYKALIHRFRRSHHSHPSVESIRKQIEAHTTVREKTSTSVDLPLSDECKRILADEWFRAVYVRPLDEAAALRVIQARKVRLEQFHEVTYADEALLLAAGWAGSLIAEGALPGKALELLDAAGAVVNLRRAEIPEIAEIQNRLRFIAKRLEDAIANHEFEKAKFYSEEEHKEQENLHAAQEQHGKQEPGANIVERSDVEQVIARWSDYPYSA